MLASKQAGSNPINGNSITGILKSFFDTAKMPIHIIVKMVTPNAG